MMQTGHWDRLDDILLKAEQLEAAGDPRGAIDLLTQTNRERYEASVELALVELRQRAAGSVTRSSSALVPVVAAPATGSLEPVLPEEVSASAVRAAWAQHGCLWVRGLIPSEVVTRLVRGIDAAFSAYDAVVDGSTDAATGWYAPFEMPDRTGSGLPAKVRRRFMRADGGIVTAESPRMLFELFELIEDLGIGQLMTEFLGERPLLSANKCTLRRIEPTDVMGGWHQDGNFLGDEIGSFNVWLALSDCGVDAPGMDIVPRRIDGVVPSDEEAQFDWSLSDRAVRDLAGSAGVVRPSFRAGDALLFDHRLVHRTAASQSMTKTRHAIEAWFFAPSAYPDGQLPLLF